MPHRIQCLWFLMSPGSHQTRGRSPCVSSVICVMGTPLSSGSLFHGDICVSSVIHVVETVLCLEYQPRHGDILVSLVLLCYGTPLCFQCHYVRECVQHIAHATQGRILPAWASPKPYFLCCFLCPSHFIKQTEMWVMLQIMQNHQDSTEFTDGWVTKCPWSELHYQVGTVFTNSWITECSWSELHRQDFTELTKGWVMKCPWAELQHQDSSVYQWLGNKVSMFRYKGINNLNNMASIPSNIF